MSLKTDCCAVKPKETSFYHKHKESIDKLVKLLEIVSAVALAAFAFYTSWQLFLPFFLVGAAIGVYGFYQNQKHNTKSNSASCSQGFLEQLTGVKLPRPVSILANVGVTVAHMSHHANVFVPMGAVIFGSWAGQRSCEYAQLAYRKIKKHKPEHVRPHPPLTPRPNTTAPKSCCHA